MTSLSDLTEQLAAAALAADTADLVTLAAVIDHLESIVPAAGRELPDPTQAEPIQSLAGSASALVQKIILYEVDDAEVSLRKVVQSAADLQQMVERALSGGTPIAPPAEQPSAAVEPAKPAAESGESVINIDDRPMVIEFIAEARTHIDSAEAELLKLEDEPDNLETVNSIFRSFHTIKGVAGFLNLGQIGKLAHAAENLLDRARKGKMKLADRSLDLVLESADGMKRLLALLELAVQSTGVVAEWSPAVDLIARLHAMNHPTAQASPATVVVPTPSIATTKIEPTVESVAVAAERTVKVATARLDALINHVGELVIAHSMVARDVATLTMPQSRLAENLSHLGKIARELQELSMAMRMVPIAGVFQKMTRVVRDVSRKNGKEIELVLIGKETELDRNVVEAIGDPLVHMIRNACDHGIESPADRMQGGKPRQGRIELKASQQSGNIVIEITDDGKGLDAGRILKKAIENGIVGADEKLSEAEIFKLVFAAGLSTAEKVTDISGRGVGMDVVKKNIESLRGRVEITSTAGKGSTFTIRLPLTLAVIDGLIVRVGSQRYILPLLSVERSIRPTQIQLSSVNGRGEMCMIRGACLPVHRLSHVFDVTGAETDPMKAIMVIVQENDRRCCLMVDELLGQEQVVIKSLGLGMDKLHGVNGGAILGDGNVSLILDVAGVIDLATDVNGNVKGIAA